LITNILLIISRPNNNFILAETKLFGVVDGEEEEGQGGCSLLCRTLAMWGSRIIVPSAQEQEQGRGSDSN